jgi:hypothetical protein
MKKSVIFGLLLATTLVFSCKKNKCSDCHYDGPTGEVELGEKCGDDLENAEKDGVNVGGVNYEVHCHEH